MTRKQLKTGMDRKIKELTQIYYQLEEIVNKTETLAKREETLIRELHNLCEELGQTWAKGCPAFIQEHIYSSKHYASKCLIQEWEDMQGTARFCINCPVTRPEAEIKVMMCKLRGRQKIEGIPS